MDHPNMSEENKQPRAPSTSVSLAGTSMDVREKQNELRILLNDYRDLISKDVVRIENLSTERQFKLLIHAAGFRKPNFVVRTLGSRLIVDASAQHTIDKVR